MLKVGDYSGRGGKSRSYALYHRGAKKPKVDDISCTLVATPLKRVVALSSVYAKAISIIGQLPCLIGVDSAAYAYDPVLISAIKAGRVEEVAPNSQLNAERVAYLRPDMVFCFGTGSVWDSHPKLEALGIPIALCAEWREAEPMARADWLLFFAAFFEKDDLAKSYLRGVDAAYRAQLEAVAAARRLPSPKVLVNGPFQGSWTLAGGRSYLAGIIRDAGGSYLWSDDQRDGAFTLSVEEVYAKAGEADFWINPGAISSLRELRMQDPRFATVKALAQGRVWSASKRSRADGANDYFESSAFCPHLVLGDMAAIFSGDTSHDYYYFQALP